MRAVIISQVSCIWEIIEDKVVESPKPCFNHLVMHHNPVPNPYKFIVIISDCIVFFQSYGPLYLSHPHMVQYMYVIYSKHVKWLCCVLVQMDIL